MGMGCKNTKLRMYWSPLGKTYLDEEIPALQLARPVEGGIC